jgi:hypothetical protein
MPDLQTEEFRIIEILILVGAEVCGEYPQNGLHRRAVRLIR